MQCSLVANTACIHTHTYVAIHVQAHTSLGAGLPGPELNSFGELTTIEAKMQGMAGFKHNPLDWIVEQTSECL